MNVLALVLVLSYASWSGIRLARHVPWSNTAGATALPTAFGLALAPFLLGISAVISLILLPGSSGFSHVAAAVGLLIVLNLFTRRGLRLGATSRATARTSGFGRRGWLWLGVLPSFAVVLIVASLVVPKNLNDALEYLLVSRDLFHTRDLLQTYPGLDSTLSPSGFFFSWTHPPTYVSLQYLFSVIEQRLDGSGFTNLLNPWITLTNVALVHAMGSLIHPRVGVIAAILFISTPLYFLGSVGGLIDPLPILGVSLIAGAMVFSDPESTRTPYAIGVSTGLSLWSHSVSVLFLPIAAMGAVWISLRAKPSAVMRNVAIVCASAVAIGFYPYARNLVAVGHLVSDNPAVVRLASLRWEEFYDYSRGIKPWAAKIQYGILKGIFAPEAYGATFTLAGVGLLLLVLGLRRLRSSAAAPEGRSAFWPADALRIQSGFALWVLAFVMGTAASVMIGTNILIRNERYFLVILGPSAVLAAAGVFAVAKTAVRQIAPRADRSQSILLGLFAALSYAGLLILVAFVGEPMFAASGTKGGHEPGGGSREETRAEPAGARRSNLRAIDWIDRTVPKDARVLSIRPGDFFYSDVRVMTHLDDRLVELYRARDKRAVVDRLEAMGVRWIYLSDYTPPTLYNSVLAEILADVDLSTLAYSADGHQVYHLVPSGRRVNQIRASEVPEQVFTRLVAVNVGGRKVLVSPVIARSQLVGSQFTSGSHMPLGLFQRHFSTYVVTGTGQSVVAAGDLRALYAVDGSELSVHVTVTGDAYVKVFAVQYDTAGHMLTEPGGSGLEFLEEVVLRNGETRSLSHRVLAKPRSRYAKVLFLHDGNSWIQVNQVAVVSYR